MQILMNFLTNAIKFTEENQEINVRLIVQEVQELISEKSVFQQSSHMAVASESSN